MSVLVFDIETVPDLVGLRQLRGTAPDIGDDALWAAIQAERAAEGKSDFMPHHLQRVLVVSCVFRSAEGLRVHSFVDRGAEGASQEARASYAASRPSACGSDAKPRTTTTNGRSRRRAPP